MLAANGGSVPVYIAFYGKWTDAQKNIVMAFCNGVGGTPYANIESGYYTTYYSSSRQYAGNGVQCQTPTTVTVWPPGASSTPSYQTSLSDDDINAIVQQTWGTLQSNAVYFVLTSGDVSQSYDGVNNFCSEYCGYHGANQYTPNGATITYQYAFVGKSAALTRHEHMVMQITC